MESDRRLIQLNGKKLQIFSIMKYHIAVEKSFTKMLGTLFIQRFTQKIVRIMQQLLKFQLGLLVKKESRRDCYIKSRILKTGIRQQ